MSTEALSIQAPAADMASQAAWTLSDLIQAAWEAIPQLGPLNPFTTKNPLAGFEDQSFKIALCNAFQYFEKLHCPPEMAIINAETIQYCQCFFDEGQARIPMPYKNKGFYEGFLLFSQHRSDSIHAEASIQHSLKTLKIPSEHHLAFMRFMLLSLPGWAGYAKKQQRVGYLALRLLLATWHWPKASDFPLQEPLINLSQRLLEIEETQRRERSYFEHLKAIFKQTPRTEHAVPPLAQFIFCMDIRSEPCRRAIEKQGPYETFGVAGFFGLPIQIHHSPTNQKRKACPALMSPQYTITEGDSEPKAVFWLHNLFKSIHRELQYNFATNLPLAEMAGPAMAILLILRTLFPKTSRTLKRFFTKPAFDSALSLDNMPVAAQTEAVEQTLKTIGLTQHFAPLVVICGHRGQSPNNPYASTLDCGACGGHPGTTNARIFAHLLNQEKIRAALAQRGICIPPATRFIAAEHNTTHNTLTPLEPDQAFPAFLNKTDSQKKGSEWAQTRSEWGLANNASFIIANRSLTKNFNLEGRGFLHSYDWQQDSTGLFLKAILDGPLMVAHTINTEYFFSTFNNVAYGGGSKITQNITGRMGIMQGNASDLMYGLALQSVYSDESTPYHSPQRLLVLIESPRRILHHHLIQHRVLKQLIQNEWITFLALDPTTKQPHSLYQLERSLTWRQIMV